MNTFFDELNSIISESGCLEAAKFFANEMRRAKRYPELFEALKMQYRIELGLPAVQTEPIVHDGNREETVIPAEVQDALDKKLLGACSEVGTALLRSGNLSEGWMYMRAVGDKRATADALRSVPVHQENLDAMLGILIHEAVDVGRGTQLSLEMRGTCNTITMLDSTISLRGRADQQAAVRELVQHIHKELLTNIKTDLGRREKPVTIGDARLPITSLLQANPGLLRDGTYHLDTTHLASAIRFARVLDDSQTLLMAADIAEYGRQLHSQYHYPSDEPFADLYPMSLAMFRALLGEHVDSALRLFLQKAESLDPQEHGTVAIETYVDLLTRVGRVDDAMAFLIKKMPRGMRPFGIAPSLIDLAEASGNFDPMIEHTRQRLDMVGYAAARLQSMSGNCVTMDSAKSQ
jgi:hypothetical protein